MDKRRMLKKEFVERGKLIEYQGVVDVLIDQILDSRCLLSICDICDTSRIEQNMDGTQLNHIRISLKNIEKPIHIIWCMLHEYGHHLSGKPTGNEKSIAHEQEAWDNGLLVLQTFSLLKQEEANYIEFSKINLQTYIEHNN